MVLEIKAALYSDMSYCLDFRRSYHKGQSMLYYLSFAMTLVTLGTTKFPNSTGLVEFHIPERTSGLACECEQL